MNVVCFGDSLTSCGGENGRYSDILQDRFPDHAIINRGNGGESFVDARSRLQSDVLSLNPDVVLVEYGANDWWRDERPPSAWAADLDAVLTEIEAAGAQAMVLGVFGPCLNAQGRPEEKEYGTDERARDYRILEKRTAAAHDCPYIDNIQRCIMNRRTCWRDRNHPNEMGNRHVADTVEDELGKLLQTPPQPVRKPTLATTRDFWFEALDLAPDKVCVVDGVRRLTYAHADEQVRALAAGIHAAVDGRPRPKVAVFLPNCLEYFLLYWALVRLGGTIVPLNTWLKADNLEHINANVQPDMLIVNSSRDKNVLQAAAKHNLKRVYALRSDGEPTPFRKLEGDPGQAPAPDLDETDVSIIMHTSGTTAAPKGAVMRHVDLMFNVMTTINAHQFKPSDVHLIVNPMFHCTALYSSLPTAAYQKATCVITSDTSADNLMYLVKEEQITTFLSIPTIFQRIASLLDPSEYHTEALRLMAYAGAVMPVSTIRRLQLYFPEVELHNFFGLTETISMTHVLTGEEAEERPDSVGRLLPFVDACIVDENLQELPPNEVGELLFDRENVIDTYYNEPERLQTSIVAIDGREWFRTGDLAGIDDEGYFFIKGRAKDMIIVGGENVYAAEVEAVIMSHDLVCEAAVKGIPATGVREVLGEMIRAYVVTRDRGLQDTDIRRHCFERLASYKIPHEIRIVESLPRNPSGKVLKDQLPD